MILRKLAEALQTQSWFTVVLEIMIVVIGIFIGLQVDDWNEARKHRQQESVYLAILRDDTMAMRANLESLIEQRELFIREMTAALRALESCDGAAEAQASIRFALGSYQASRGISYLDATFNEMVASGSLARIERQPLKRAISDTFSALEDLNGSILSFRVSMPVVDSIIWKNVSFTIDPDTTRTSAEFDVQHLCSQAEVRNAFVEMIDIQRDGMGFAQSVLAQVDSLLPLMGEIPEPVE